MTIESPSFPVRTWLPSLQSLRGFAALWVVFYHVDVIRVVLLGGETTGIPGTRLGWLGVDMFFVLSGFLLAPLFFHRPPKTGAFWLDRFLRVGPAYYVAVVASLAFIFVVYRELVTWPDTAWNALAALLFFSNLNLDTHFGVNPVFWTLAVEMHFYLLLPLIGRWFATRTWWLALGVCLGISLYWRAWTVDWVTPWPEASGLFLGSYTLPAFLGHFALGAAAARIQRIRYPTAAWWLGLCLALLPPVLLFPSGSVEFHFPDLTQQVLVRPLSAVGFALIVLATATKGPVQDLLSISIFRHLGAISYSLYLVHYPILLGLLQVLDPIQHPWWFLALGVALSLAAGHLMWQWVEHPADRWRRKRKVRADARQARDAS